MTKNMNNSRVKHAVDFIKNRKTKDNDWRINNIYKTDGFISFDKRGRKGEWVSYMLEKYLNQVTKQEHEKSNGRKDHANI